jgi:ketosteroid isomerase-like protein
MNKTKLVKELYQCIDNLDVNGLSSFLSEDIKFKFSNFDALDGKEAVLDSNRNFFSSIKGMRHTIDNIWEDGDVIICNGSVDYIRLDLTKHNIVFATKLKIKKSKIQDYLIFADVSLL